MDDIGVRRPLAEDVSNNEMAGRFAEMSRQTALAALDAVLMSVPPAGDDQPVTLTDWADVRAVADHVSIALEEMEFILHEDPTG